MMTKQSQSVLYSILLQGGLLVQATQNEIKKCNKLRKTTLKGDFTLLNLPKPDVSYFSQEQLAQLDSFSVYSSRGAVRAYNEDRTTVAIKRCEGFSAYFFGLYDGHGGEGCVNFLKSNLHNFILNNQNLQLDPQKSIIEGYRKAQQQFLRNVEPGDNSGSCAATLLIIKNMCYVANLGDSRVVLASKGYKLVYDLTKDHKPTSVAQQQRILAAGGTFFHQFFVKDGVEGQKGPMRVLPGQLSITRAFGNQHAKLQLRGGKSGVIIAQPQIIATQLKSNHKCIVMVCDGVTDRLSSRDIMQTVKSCQYQGGLDWYKHTARRIVLQALNRGSQDNLTSVVINLPSLHFAIRG